VKQPQFLIGVLAAVAFMINATAFAEEVDVPGLEGTDHALATVPGHLFLPDEPLKPRVGVLYLHGCTGLHGREDIRNMESWAAWYNELGIAFLALDSHKPRGVSVVCTLPQPYLVSEQRPLDAIAGNRYLVENGFAASGSVFVHGLSQGGATVLRALKDSRTEEYRFAGGISFYPYCTTGRYRPYAPVIILVGERDKWTPPERCQVMVNRSQGISPGVDLLVYPGATHSFDYQFPEVTNAFGFRVGGHPSARADSRRRVRAFIERTLDR